MRLAGHRVGGDAARKLDDAAGRGAGRGDEPVVEALFAVAHGELGVGREQEQRVGVALAVVRDVRHARLLVGAEQEADSVGEALGDAVVLEVLPELDGVQRDDAGALVVDDAAADEVAVLARDLVGLERPAGAGGHHVHVADDADLAVGAAGQVGVADVALDVARPKPHALGHLERGGQRLARPGAVRRALGGLVQLLDAGDAHQRVDVGDDVVPMLVEVCVDLVVDQGFVHESSFGRLVARPSSRTGRRGGRIGRLRDADAPALSFRFIMRQNCVVDRRKQKIQGAAS